MITALMLLACVHKSPESSVSQVDPLATRPEVSAPTPFAGEVAQAFTLDNGVSVWLVERPGLPLVSLRVVVRGGSATDPADKPGLAAITDRMMTHGAGERDAAAFASAVEQLALTLAVGTDEVSSTVHLDAHAERLDQGLALMTDAMRRPTFDKAELDRVRELRLGELAEGLDDPAVRASWVARTLYWGASHPLGHPEIGDAAGLGKVTAADVKASWAQRFRPGNMQIVVVGDVTADELKASLNTHLGDWTGEATATPMPPAPARSGGPGLFLVDNPGASQAVLRVIMPGPAADAPDLLATRLGVVVLGGTFTSRLNRLLREEKGYTYGARASVVPQPGYGTVVVSTAVRGDVAGPALSDLLGEVRKVTEGVTAEEAEKARGARSTSLVEAVESRGSTASTFATYAERGLSPDALRVELERLASVDEAAIDAALARLDLGAGVVVVVGDLASIGEPVRAAVPGEWQVIK